MKAVMVALRKMHNLERFATEIYRMQITAFPEKEISDKLKIARATSRSILTTSRRESKHSG